MLVSGQVGAWRWTIHGGDGLVGYPAVVRGRLRAVAAAAHRIFREERQRVHGRGWVRRAAGEVQVVDEDRRQHRGRGLGLVPGVGSR